MAAGIVCLLRSFFLVLCTTIDKFRIQSRIGNDSFSNAVQISDQEQFFQIQKSNSARKTTHCGADFQRKSWSQFGIEPKSLIHIAADMVFAALDSKRISGSQMTPYPALKQK